MSSLISIIIQIILLFVIPILLLRYHHINRPYRFLLYLGISFIAFTIMLLERWSLNDIGLRTDTLVNALLPYTLFTLMSGIGIAIYAKARKRKPQKNLFQNKYFQFMFIVFAFLQQFIFQGFLIRQLQSLIIPTIVIITIVTFLFMFMHAIYANFYEALPLTFFAGAGFAFLYLTYQNLIIATISHAILNFITVYYGFFTKPAILQP